MVFFWNQQEHKGYLAADAIYTDMTYTVGKH